MVWILMLMWGDSERMAGITLKHAKRCISALRYSICCLSIQIWLDVLVLHPRRLQIQMKHTQRGGRDSGTTYPHGTPHALQKCFPYHPSPLPPHHFPKSYTATPLPCRATNYITPRVSYCYDTNLPASPSPRNPTQSSGMRARSVGFRLVMMTMLLGPMRYSHCGLQGSG